MENDIANFVRYTNLQARRVLAKDDTRQELKGNWTPVDDVEMKAFVGLHIAAGANKEKLDKCEQIMEYPKI